MFKKIFYREFSFHFERICFSCQADNTQLELNVVFMIFLEKRVKFFFQNCGYASIGYVSIQSSFFSVSLTEMESNCENSCGFS